MGKWAAGVAATVVGGLVLAWVLTNGPGTGPKPAVVAFNQYGSSRNAAPSASITVENGGKKTATDCQVVWEPGMLGPAGVAVQVTSVAFALDGGRSDSLTLQSPYVYGAQGTYYGRAWIGCDGHESRVSVTRPIFVLL